MVQERWGDTITFSGIISGAAGITFQRAASGTTEYPVFLLSGANTHTGAITAGANATVRVGNIAGLGTVAGTTTVNATGALDLNGIAVGAEPVTLNGNGAGATPIGALLNSSATAASLSGAVTLASNSSIGGSGAGAMTLSGVVSGGFTLSKLGTGTTILSAANTYTGATTVSAGQLRLTGATSLPGGIGATGGTANLSLNGGILGLGAGDFSRGLGTGATQVQLAGVSGFSATGAVRTVNFGGANAQLTWGSGSFAPTTLLLGAANADNTLVISNPIDLNGAARTVQVDNGTAASDAQLSGVVGGSGQLVKTGAGTLVLSGANTFSTSIGYRAGIVQFNSVASASSADIAFVSGDTGRVVANAGLTIPNNITIGTGVAGATGGGVIGQAGTGQATFSGSISLSGLTGSGGVVIGSNTVGNELILAGPISGTVGFSQRDGRVIYSGGGSATGTFISTGTVLVGANNGIPTGFVLNPGGSGATTIDLNGFNQTSAGLNLATGGNSATVNLGAKVLTLNGDVSFAGTTTTATINATTGSGTLALGAVARNFTIADSSVVDDTTLNNVTLTGSGGFTKLGAGNLAFNNTTSSAPFTLAAGAITIGTSLTPGSASFSSLNLTGGTINMDLGGTSDTISAGALTTSGTTTFNLTQLGGSLPVGTYTLISYSGTGPGVGNLAIGASSHITGSLVDTGSAINLVVSANDTVYWTGASSTSWATGATGNWALTSTNAATDFFTADEVIFKDSPTSASVVIAANVAPSAVSFTNSTTTTYTVSGAAGIAGNTGLTKSGNGTTILANPNPYTGATSITGGTLELDLDATGNVVLSGTSGISISSGAKLALSRDDADFTLARNLSGTGTVEINPHSIVGTTTARSTFLTGTNTGFSGSVVLLAPLSGTYRLQGPAQASLGSSTLDVRSGAQLYLNATTISNNITIAGTGYAETGTSGSIGALRIDTTTYTGNVTINGSARIGAHNSTSTISGNISGGNLEANATNFNNSYTLILTGANTYGTTTLGGQNTQVAGTPTMRLNIGNGGTSGSLGTGNVVINGDSANGVLGFDRSDGYTLTLGQSITAGGSRVDRTFIDIDTKGTGFSDNGSTITLGAASAAGTAGGQFRVGQSRSGAIANLSGALTTGQLYAGSATPSTTNLNSGAVVSTGILHVGRTGATGSILNINSGSNLTVNGQFNIGEQAAGNAGTVTQSGGSVSVGDQTRLGHWGSETSNYNL